MDGLDGAELLNGWITEWLRIDDNGDRVGGSKQSWAWRTLQKWEDVRSWRAGETTYNSLSSSSSSSSSSALSIPTITTTITTTTTTTTTTTATAATTNNTDALSRLPTPKHGWTYPVLSSHTKCLHDHTCLDLSKPVVLHLRDGKSENPNAQLAVSIGEA